jgi:hypothetical protein
MEDRMPSSADGEFSNDAVIVYVPVFIYEWANVKEYVEPRELEVVPSPQLIITDSLSPVKTGCEMLKYSSISDPVPRNSRYELTYVGAVFASEIVEM